MKRKNKTAKYECCCNNTCADMIAEETKPTKANKEKKEKLSADEKIYRFLDTTEKIAVILANKQKSKKKKAKKQAKKNKKVGKIDKKTGALVLKKIKKDKVQKPMKRYKPPKKK